MIEPRDSAFVPRAAPGASTSPILPFPSNMLGVEALARAGLVIEEQFRTRIGDEFRITAGRVQALVEANIAAGVPAANTVMVTSTRPGEGKSFSSVNLAATLAQLRRRPVLLVDIDSKPGSFTDLAGLLGRPGLFELVGNADRDARSVIMPTVIQGLSVLPLGNPMAARELCPLQGTLVALGEQFPDTTLLLDAGPCLATSDPSVLAPTVGQIVMVVEAERTQRSEVEAALDLVRSCPRIVLLLNKAAARTSAAFGAYGTYGAYYARPAGAPKRG